MSNFNEQRRLADRAGQVLGPAEADTLMTMLTGIDRVELQLTKLRAELDQKFAAIDQRFAQIDQRFVDVDRQMLGIESTIMNAVRVEFKSMKRFILTTAVSVLALGAGIAALVVN